MTLSSVYRFGQRRHGSRTFLMVNLHETSYLRTGSQACVPPSRCSIWLTWETIINIMRTSTGENPPGCGVVDKATSAPLLLFQPPGDHLVPIILKSSAAEHTNARWEEHERNRARTATDEVIEERSGDALYFFYGSLMDLPVLPHVLSLTERPRLKPASIVGYHIKT